MKEGKLIVIEGACDGIGKSTQYALLRDRLLKENYQVDSHHFPSYNTYYGKAVEVYLSGGFGTHKDLSPYFVNNLYANDRAIAWYSDLKFKFEQGHIILLDRYTTSSIIYQSALIDDISKKKDFINYVKDFEYEKLGIKEPDQTLFLHAPFDLVSSWLRNRKNNEGVRNDIHERDLEFMRRVYENAMFVADYLGWDMINCSSNDKLDSIYDIHEKVYSLVNLKK